MRAGWFGSAYKACAALRPGRFDLILATGGPWGTFSLARRLSKRLRCPFVLDYRDPWTAGNPHEIRYKKPRWRRREAEILAAASAVSIVSSNWGQLLRQHFPHAPKIEVIPNGYDPAEMAGIEPQHFGHFALVYAGTFCPPLRSATPLVAALKRLQEISPGNDCHFHCFGPHGDYLLQEAAAHGVSQRIVLHGKVPRREALAAIGGANAVAIVTSVEDRCGAESKGIVTGKIFEPVGLGTPVLLVAPADSDARGVLATVGNGRAFVGSDVGGMAAYLRDLAAGRLPERGRPEAYSWAELAAKLNVLLRETLPTPRPERAGTR